ncbi:hypothetical protein [Streptomyces sp. t39]|uniref:hypothetical protein n=1 Tax=Streptomyces sp. t39 TaxID=1828156 RepID=UPI0011CE6C9A|nr:hypothetical protein [Streptomyces sp. t39]TXS51320.1 hypothetical protein EAO77_25920 [Streptomyces sp. t39]
MSSWHRPLVAFAASMALLAALTAVGLVVDDRTVAGSPVWFKPFKFSVSFVAYALSLAWMLSLLPRFRRIGWWAGTTVMVASAAEMVLITGQALRGRRSHFNHETPLDSALYDAMAVSVVVLWSGALAIAVLLFRARIADRASAWAIRCGSVVALAGAATGFLMVRPTDEQRAAGGAGDAGIVGAHAVGVPDGGPSMPVTGWATTGGDLRIGHFVGMHALQVLPLVLLVLAALAPRFARLADERVRLRLVLIASAAYAGAFVLVTWQALRGQALFRPDGITLTAAAVLALATAAAVAAALRTAPPGPPGPPAAEDADRAEVAV